MIPLSAADVRTSFINASLRERKAITLPPNFDNLTWASLDYLGWRDQKFPEVGYVVMNLDDGPVGILLRRVEGKTRSRPQCSWCEDVTLPNDVIFFTAKKAGSSGRAGATVSTLICENFECSANVRKLPPLPYAGFDLEAARLKRIETLELRLRKFVATIGNDS